MIMAGTLQNTEIQESRSEILQKIISGEYWLLRREERSTVWHVYRQIVRSDGSKLRGQYFCTGCKRLMQSRDTTSLRSHTCHVKYLRDRVQASEDLDPKDERRRKNSGHRVHWSFRATKTLLQLWEENSEHLQNDHRSQARIFRKIAQEMNHLGLKPSDIKTKIDSLIDRYKAEVEREKVSRRPSKWHHFHGVQKILIGDNSTLEENKPPPPEQMYGDERRQDERLTAIREERLALEKEQIKTFKYIMKDMLSYHKSLFQLLNSNE